MTQFLSPLLMLVVLLSLASLGIGRIALAIRIVALQGIVLGALLLVTHEREITLRLLLLAGANIGLKGIVMPWLLQRSMREAHVQQEMQPYVGYSMSLALGAAALIFAFVLARYLPLPQPSVSHLIVPVSLMTVFTGLLLLVSRRMAVSQVLGYLVLENGILTFSLALAVELPALVEMGVLLDLFVGVFVMGIAIYHISREFDHIDASRMSSLRDVNAKRSSRSPTGGR